MKIIKLVRSNTLYLLNHVSIVVAKYFKGKNHFTVASKLH